MESAEETEIHKQDDTVPIEDAPSIEVKGKDTLLKEGSDQKREEQNGHVETISQQQQAELANDVVTEEDPEKRTLEALEKADDESKGIQNHRRSTSKVEAIEAPTKSILSSINPNSHMVRTASSSSSSLRPETSQHRHDPKTDQASSYQPNPPQIYLHLRAVALQLPNVVTVSTSNASHIEPPTVILQGRTNLSSARRSFYPKVVRTLPELHLWLLALTLSFPASIFSPFIYPTTALMQGESASDAVLRDYLVTITNQLSRILVKPYVLSHPATVALVECDFNYTPTLPHIGPGSSSSARKRLEEGIRIARTGYDPLRGKRGKGGTNNVTSMWDADGVAAALGLPTSVFAGSNDNTTAASTTSKNPLSLFTRANASPQRIQIPPPVALPPGEEDEDEEDLTLARNEITRLEMQFEKASQAAHMVMEKSGFMSAALNQLIQALSQLERLDSGRVIAKQSHEEQMIKIMVRGIEGWAAAEAGSGSTITSTIAPSMSYQSFNARMAIDALLRRAAAATHRHSALIVLVQKRREAERLKRARGEIRQDEVDWVLSELKEAQRTTNLLTHHLATFTATLKEELKKHSRSTHTDVQSALLSHARNSIRAQRFMLNNFKKARDDLLAKKEGKPIQETADLQAISAELAPIPTTVKEERLVPVVEQETRPGSVDVDVKEKQSTAVQDVAKGEAEVEDTLTLSKEKALPVAPIDKQTMAEDSVQRDTIPDSKAEQSSEPMATKLKGAEEPEVNADDKDRPTSIERPTSIPTSLIDTSSNIKSSDMTQSGFLPPPSSSPRVENLANMSQSAFLPARNTERYANPFARLDPSLSSAPPVPSLNPNNPSNKAKANDVWANRSRLSASDAAKSLAGRF